MTVEWPGHRRLIEDLRDILRREFGCQDAWVVNAGSRLRLDVRIRGRQVTLLEDLEDRFWAMFYVPVEQSRLHLGERIVQLTQRRKPRADLVAVLTPYWIDRVGPLPRRSSLRPLNAARGGLRSPRLRSGRGPGA